jgi:hypothetical protein
MIDYRELENRLNRNMDIRRELEQQRLVTQLIRDRKSIQPTRFAQTKILISRFFGRWLKLRTAMVSDVPCGVPQLQE